MTPSREDRHSCYTAALARYLEHLGESPAARIDAQLFLAVRESADGVLSFVHHHTPLRGAEDGFQLELRCADEATAADAIRLELERVGACILTGDTWRLPWSVEFGRRHAPHWVLLDGRQPGAVRIHDAFTYLGSNAEQRPYRGWVRERIVASFAARPPCTPTQACRDRHAFGDIDAGTSGGSHGWFELVSPPGPTRRSPEHAARESLAHHLGTRQRLDLLDTGFTAGPSAFELLVAAARTRLSDPGFYECSDDLWVAGRNRHLFLDFLDEDPRFRGTVAWARQEVLPAWDALPRVLLYNRTALELGRSPRPLLVEHLRRVGERERLLYRRLARDLEDTDSLAS